MRISGPELPEGPNQEKCPAAPLSGLKGQQWALKGSRNPKLLTWLRFSLETTSNQAYRAKTSTSEKNIVGTGKLRLSLVSVGCLQPERGCSRPGLREHLARLGFVGPVVVALELFTVVVATDTIIIWYA